MAERIDITDPADRRLDDFRDLVTADRRPDRPGGRGLVIAEGVVVVRRLLQSPYLIRGLLGVARRYDELADDLSTQAVPYFAVEPELMAEVVGFHLNRGVLATANRAASPLPDELISRSTALAVLEGVGDHENLGSIFRSAAALGVDGVLLGAGCADPLYRRSVRVSMGTVLQIPFAALPGWPDGGADLLRAGGFRLVALTPRAGALRLAEAGLARGRIAVLLGSEGPGLTDDALAAADLHVRIPMSRAIDSLNVGTAAAIAFAAMDRRVPAGWDGS